jgi:predicted transcriptional regulator
MRDEMPHGQRGPEDLLGELEAAIMQLIWQRGEVTVREVWEALQASRPLAYTTVMTVMSRLVPKGVLATRKQGKTYFYRATATPNDFVAQRARLAVREVLSSFGDLALSQFLRELDGMDPERLNALRALAREEDTDAR